MQQMYPRTNPVTQLEEALRNSVRQNAIDIRHESENTTDVNSLVQRVAGVSLDQLDDVIIELQQLRDFLHSEGERIRREISGYLQLNHIAIDSTKSIVENIVQLKTATHKITRAGEASDFVASEISPPPSAAAKDVVIIRR
jgi:hypothetical protein